MLQWSSFLMICSSRFCKETRRRHECRREIETTKRAWEEFKRQRNLYTHTHEFISKLNDCRTETRGRQTPDPRTDKRKLLYLEPLILQNLLDGHHLLAVDEASLVHHTERPVADHLQEKRKPSNEHQIIRWRADTDTCCRFEFICVSPGVQITSVTIFLVLGGRVGASCFKWHKYCRIFKLNIQYRVK